ncbi:MAG: hypothetical protein ACREJG_03185 [Candidatus Rokuibacteriota bacterium]
MRRGVITVGAVVLLLMHGVAGAQSFGTVGGERYFRLDWEGGRSERWGPIVSGYIYNDYGAPATNLRLLVEALDEAGKTVSTHVTLVPGTAPGNNRLYFEQRVPAAARYRLRILSWDFIRGGGGL